MASTSAGDPSAALAPPPALRLLVGLVTAARDLRLLDGRLVVGRADLEVLDVERPARLDDDALLQALLHVLEEGVIGGGQHLRDVRVDLDQHGVALDEIALPAQLAEQLVGDGAPRLGVALALAGRARLGQRVQQRLARALARHLDEAQLGDARDRRLRAVLAQVVVERPRDLLAVVRAIHVDEVDDDHAADGPDAQLLGDLAAGLEVGLGDGVFEARLADEAPGVDVDGGQRLHLVDDEVAARLEPDLALERAVDLDLDAVAVEDRVGAVVKLDVAREVGHERGDELLDPVVLGLRESMISFSTSAVKRSRTVRSSRSRSL